MIAQQTETLRRAETLRRRLLVDVLPAAGLQLLTDGMHPSHVSMLYPLDAAVVIERLLDRLWLAAGFRSRRAVMGFMQHVARGWTRRQLSRADLLRLFPTLASPTMLPIPLRLQGIADTISTYHADTFNSSYRCLSRTIEVLMLWLTGDDTNFSDGQLGALRAVMAFWFEVLDFDGVPDRVW